MSRKTSPSLVLLLLALLGVTHGFTFRLTARSIRSNDVIRSSTALKGTQKSVIQDALRSITGKLSYAPEIVLPDPIDPTAMLLLTSNIQKMSAMLRSEAKASVLWIGSNSENNLATLVSEQEESRGSFPGPIPVIYCGGSTSSNLLSVDAIKKAGAIGVVLSIGKDDDNENVIQSLEDVSNVISKSSELYHAYVSADLEVIPEVSLCSSFAKNCDMEALVDAVVSNLCGGEDPTALLISVVREGNVILEGKPSTEDAEIYEIDESEFPLPTVPKQLTKRVPIVCSVKCAATVVSQCAALVKKAGFNGAVLHADCIPGGSRINPDLDFVGRFWAYIVGDLKSLRSKSFGFRAKMDKLKMTRDVPAEWAKLHQDVAESGALGAPGIQQDPSYKDVNDGASYKGF